MEETECTERSERITQHLPLKHADGSFLKQQKPVCTDMKKESWSQIHKPLSVHSRSSDHKKLSGELTTPAQSGTTEFVIPTALDCPDNPSSEHASSTGDQEEGKVHIEETAGLNLDKKKRLVPEKQDLDLEERDQKQLKKTANSESMKNQLYKPSGWQKQEGAVPAVMITTLEENDQEGPEEDARIVTTSSVMEGPEEDTRSVTTSSVLEGFEEDTRSVTASSVMSLFQRMQMDPMERDWLRCAALGNAPGLHQLLLNDPSLIFKKDFVTMALHWAAKQGHIDTVDLMARSGTDVNQQAGYTALHLASLHGHAHIVQLLVNKYNANANIRDYHGKMASYYWTGSKDIFDKADCQTGRKWSRESQSQRYPAQLSLFHNQSNVSTEVQSEYPELTPHFSLTF